MDHDAAGRELRRASAAGFVLESSWDAAGQLVRQVGGVGVPAREPERSWSGSMSGTERTRRCRWPTCAGAAAPLCRRARGW
nr:hypothetical protein [Methylobacterium fujisawaense]